MTKPLRTIIYGGGTFNPVRVHIALAAMAFGETARFIYDDLVANCEVDDVVLRLTKMADPTRSKLVTNEDVEKQLMIDVADPTTKTIVFNVALCDFEGTIDGVKSGKYASRLKSRAGPITMDLTASPKLLGKIRKERKDIFLVAFKTTCGATHDEQYKAGLNLLKEASCNLVLANDILTERNIIIVPEEAYYTAEDFTGFVDLAWLADDITNDRHKILYMLTDMMMSRRNCTFTRSTVLPALPGKGLLWKDGAVPVVLKTVVDHCISKGAYKPFRGATAGHFAYRISDHEFATSRRKTDFNHLSELGLVYVKSSSPDSVLAFGAKPSVGGQSQRIIFAEHPGFTNIVHFHSPPREGVVVPEAPEPQWKYECGSHQCGQNTSDGLVDVGPGIKSVYLSNHGPNIVFTNDADPQEVIHYIEENYDLSQKVGGLVS